MPIMFAHDKNLFLKDLLLDRINVEMANVQAWFKANNLSLNMDKTILYCFPQNDGHSLWKISQLWM